MKVGILSNITHPLLYFFIQNILKFGTKDIVVILDKKEQSKKDLLIFKERTNNYFKKYSKINLKKYFDLKKIDFFYVENHNNKDCFNLIKKKNISCLINAGTPRKISNNLIKSVKNGVVNIHPGSLPKYRGKTCVEWAIYNNDKIANTAHFMDKNYDSGPIIKKEYCFFNKNDNYQNIRIKVYKAGCILAGKVLFLINKNNIQPKNLKKQNKRQSNFYDVIDKKKFLLVKKIILNKRYKYQLK